MVEYKERMLPVKQSEVPPIVTAEQLSWRSQSSRLAPATTSDDGSPQLESVLQRGPAHEQLDLRRSGVTDTEELDELAAVSDSITLDTTLLGRRLRLHGPQSWPAGDELSNLELEELAMATVPVLGPSTVPTWPRGNFEGWRTSAERAWELLCVLAHFPEHCHLMCGIWRQYVTLPQRDRFRPDLYVPSGWDEQWCNAAQLRLFLLPLLGVHAARQWSRLGWGVERILLHTQGGRGVGTGAAQVQERLKELSSSVDRVGNALGYYLSFLLLPSLLGGPKMGSEHLFVAKEMAFLDDSFAALETLFELLAAEANEEGAPAYAREAWSLMHRDERLESRGSFEAMSEEGESEPLRARRAMSSHVPGTASEEQRLDGLLQLLSDPSPEPITGRTLQEWSTTRSNTLRDNLAGLLLIALEAAHTDELDLARFFGLDALPESVWKGLKTLPIPSDPVQLLGAFILHQQIKANGQSVGDRVDAGVQWMLRALHPTPLGEEVVQWGTASGGPSKRELHEWLILHEPLLSVH